MNVTTYESNGKTVVDTSDRWLGGRRPYRRGELDAADRHNGKGVTHDHVSQRYELMPGGAS
jgi:hypothetical protein